MSAENNNVATDVSQPLSKNQKKKMKARAAKLRAQENEEALRHADSDGVVAPGDGPDSDELRALLAKAAAAMQGEGSEKDKVGGAQTALAYVAEVLSRTRGGEPGVLKALAEAKTEHEAKERSEELKKRMKDAKERIRK